MATAFQNARFQAAGTVADFALFAANFLRSRGGGQPIVYPPSFDPLLAELKSFAEPLMEAAASGASFLVEQPSEPPSPASKDVHELDAPVVSAPPVAALGEPQAAVLLHTELEFFAGWVSVT